MMLWNLIFKIFPPAAWFALASIFLCRNLVIIVGEELLFGGFMNIRFLHNIAQLPEIIFRVISINLLLNLCIFCLCMGGISTEFGLARSGTI